MRFPLAAHSIFLARRSASMDAGQVIGSPLFETDRLVTKFHNLWSIEATAIKIAGSIFRPIGTT